MIHIVIERAKETNEIRSFTISGHANAGPHGFDIVCAAVSALSIGAVNAVTTLCHVELPVESGKQGGYLRCDIPSDLSESVQHDVQLLIEGMCVALRDIGREYSKYITMNEKRI